MRRFLLIAAIALWVGGLTFYATFVLPEAHHVLDSHLQTGLITRGVTLRLNHIGVIVIVLMLWDLLATRASRKHTAALLMLWLIITTAHVGLLVMHTRLSAMVDAVNGVTVDPNVFRVAHTRYEQITGGQWCATLAYLAATLTAWKRRDRAEAAMRTPPRVDHQ